MRVFLSWSGSASHNVARALRDWLPSVLPFVSPWVSSEDISKGKRWSAVIAEELEDCSYCIVCVTPETARQPWINFEAGAIAKVVSDSHVSPLLVGTPVSELRDLPLSMFQATVFEKADVLRLVESVNAAAPTPIPADRLKRTFRLCWPGLDTEIGAITLSIPSGAPENGEDEDDDGEVLFLEEIQEQILTLVAEMGDQHPTAEVIAHHVNENLTRTRYHIDRLVRIEYLHNLLSMMAPTRYMITEKGRSYLVENDLV